MLEFNSYHDRQKELEALAENIQRNLTHDELESHQILVVVLGKTEAAIRIEQQAACYLRSQGIRFYIPGALQANDLRVASTNRNQFWCEDAVTVSRIHRAKGNEADMVYVIGFDQVAENESDVTLRNQIFVALTRARGWATLSGIGTYPLYEEMAQVIASGNSFTFTATRPLKRDISEEVIQQEADS